MSAVKPLDMDRETEITGSAEDVNRDTEITGNADDNGEVADESSGMRENGVVRQGNVSIPLLKSTQQTTAVQTSHVSNKGCTLQLFIVNICFLVLFYMCMNIYGSGVVRTLERRFGLRSSQTGLMSSANDVIHVCIVVFIGYFGRTGHKPRIICVTVLFTALAGFMMASPHFLMSSTHDTVRYRMVNFTNTSSLLSKTSNRFCLNWNTSGDAISGDQCDLREESSSQTAVHPAYYVFLTAQFISGIGGSRLHTLSLAYIDENAPGSKSSLYIGKIRKQL